MHLPLVMQNFSLPKTHEFLDGLPRWREFLLHVAQTATARACYEARGYGYKWMDVCPLGKVGVSEYILCECECSQQPL